MNRSRPARGCGVRRRAILVVALLGVAAGAETAAETAAPTATATASQRLQQRFVASVEGWRKTAPKLSDKKPPESPPAHEAQLLRELRVVVAPTAVPVLRVQRRGDGHTLIVSAGWLALLDELLRAEAAYTMPPAGGTRCFDDYVDQVLAVVYDNGERASRQQPQPLQAWPPARRAAASAARAGLPWRRLVELHLGDEAAGHAGHVSRPFLRRRSVLTTSVRARA
jgi:hypothetical protein